jgi:hypothetical protein
VKLGIVIARRDLAKGRSTKPSVTVQIGRPRRDPDGPDWLCPYRILGGEDDSVRAAYGVDAVQALHLAENAVAARLDAHPRLRWLGRDHDFRRSDTFIGEQWQRAISFAWDGRQRSPVPGPWPLELHAAPKKASRCFFFTKNYLLRLWLRAELLPENTDALVSYGVPSARVCDVVREHARRVGRPMQFIGDLDPLDLAAYVALGAGGAPLRRARRRSVPVEYAGIDDRWLDACERYVRRSPVASYTIRLSMRERDQLAALQRAGLDLDSTVGPKCASLLRAGYKLEIEGATNPAIFQPGLHRELRGLLLRGRRSYGGSPARPRSR